MNKYEALAITGRLEVQLQSQEMLLNEIAKLQKSIAEEDSVGAAISFGRLSELTQKPNIDVSENLEALAQFVTTSTADGETQRLESMPIEELDLSIRSFNCLKRAGKCTLRDILAIPKSKLRDGKTIRNLGTKSAEEVIKAVETRGFKLKD